MPLYGDSTYRRFSHATGAVSEPQRTRARAVRIAYCGGAPLLLAILALMQKVSHGELRTLLWWGFGLVVLAVICLPWVWPFEANREAQSDAPPDTEVDGYGL